MVTITCYLETMKHWFSNQKQLFGNHVICKMKCLCGQPNRTYSMETIVSNESTAIRVFFFPLDWDTCREVFMIKSKILGKNGKHQGAQVWISRPRHFTCATSWFILTPALNVNKESQSVRRLPPPQWNFKETENILAWKVLGGRFKKWLGIVTRTLGEVKLWSWCILLHVRFWGGEV